MAKGQTENLNTGQWTKSVWPLYIGAADREYSVNICRNNLKYGSLQHLVNSSPILRLKQMAIIGVGEGKIGQNVHLHGFDNHLGHHLFLNYILERPVGAG